ncbi:hypothetical protein SEA_SOUL22_94 [Mycobacterium phage Soul22]|uniref:Uncharacterized protein n=1 Tax=Mycobacterium phage Soul22 TaxID=2743996 RepID=A0A7D5JIK0_9CAUD|nr:hypothetical protein I5I03_gp094 [Mycobacterium phage Soul22]QLF84311.1 hypothetical protein SEA_SOUL22_94 [Mycobacterium phage Soul22]
MTQPNDEGHLPAARAEFQTAITAFIDPIPTLHNGNMLHAPSLYMQLFDAVGGEQAQTGNGGGSKSKPPLWTDALVLLQDIDLMVSVWQPGYKGIPPTIARLRFLQEQSWRPQDVKHLEKMTSVLKSWCEDIDRLFNPVHVKHVSAPCPNCNATHTYRRDNAGENVRVPALQLITSTGCTCLVCRTIWPPEQFLFLCKLLGFDLPKGVTAE